MKEVREALVVVGEPVLPGEPHPLVVEPSQDSTNQGFVPSGRRPQGAEARFQLPTQSDSVNHPIEGLRVVSRQHAQLTMESLRPRGLDEFRFTRVPEGQEGEHLGVQLLPISFSV